MKRKKRDYTKICRVTRRSFSNAKNGLELLTSELHHVSRRFEILLCRASNNCNVCAKEEHETGKPRIATTATWNLLRHTAKYLKGTSDVSLMHRIIQKRVLEEVKKVVRKRSWQTRKSVRDLNWAADRKQTKCFLWCHHAEWPLDSLSK